MTVCNPQRRSQNQLILRLSTWKHGTPVLNIKQARKLNLQIPLNLKGCGNERRGLQMNLIVSSIGQGLLWALLGLGLYLTFLGILDFAVYDC